MKLHFRKYGEGEPLLILHGVFGSSDNWQTVGKAFAENYEVYLIDQRNHGNSPHHEDFNYDVMANDLLELMDDHKLESAHILGHSMGGKTAMNFAATFPERVKKLIVVDIAPKFYAPHHQQIIEGFRSVDLDALTSRGEADKAMSTVISNMGIRLFLLKNLKREDSGFGWKINLDVIERNITNVGSGLEADQKFDGHTLFIAGGNSDYIQEHDFGLISSHFSNYKFEKIEGAGHWVHAEKPKELFEIVSKFLTS
ncbi:MAG: alpha/beta fold hydrolase [bacterium]|nr:alpha/beta fold hydrolase [bacterium]